MGNSTLKAGTAVVVGAGMGGLTAAKVLAEHFTRVILLERDELPRGPLPRAGVPQGRHVHGLLGGGLDALAQLFPGREVVASADRSGVSAVRIEKHSGAAETLQTDLVVDATGRASLTMDFLQSNGYGLPEESSIAVDIRYTCGVFVPPPDSMRDWKVLMTRPAPLVSGRRTNTMGCNTLGRDRSGNTA
jgi:flavin-dependent dehydrogenase